MPRSAWGRECGTNIGHVVTVPCDTPFLPDDLVARFLAALEETGRECCVARSGEGVHPVIGLWPIGIGTLQPRSLRVSARQAPLAEQQGAVEVFSPRARLGGRAIDPFFNINRPEDLAEANALLAAN